MPFSLFLFGAPQLPLRDGRLLILLSVQGKAKKNAWQKIVDDGLTAEQAQEKYVAYIEELKKKYGYDADKAPEAVGSS